MQLNVIIASTRPGRVGKPVGDWFIDHAKKHGGFEVVTVDLKEVGLPMLDEPRHPRLGQYEHAHTKAWSAIVDAADAYVIVTPEYNYSAPPSLVNALDYLYREWGYKPAGFVSYGGVSGGTRSVVAARQILATLKMVPLVEQVTIPFVAKHIAEDKTFTTNADIDKSATAMLDELHRWAGALKPLRT